MTWQLARESHAIERVAVVLTFAEPIPSRQWLKILSKADKDTPSFGFVVVNNTLNQGFRFVARMGDVGMGLEQVQEQVNAGRHFQRFSGSELQEELVLNRSSFSYVTPIYTRWSAFQARVMEMFKPSLDLSLELVALQSAKLEYWDRWVFDGPINDVNYDELLRSNSKYIPGSPIGLKELWHSHVGFFSPVDAAQRRLMHLNVDVIDTTNGSVPAATNQPELRRSVGIYSMAQDTVILGDGMADADAVSTKLHVMHLALKDVLREVLTEQAAKNIKLDSSGAS